MAFAIDLCWSNQGHLENSMSTLAQRAETVPRWTDLPLTRASKTYFLLGQEHSRIVGHSRKHGQEGRRVRLA